MESYLHKITINPDVCNGKPTIRGMRITVKTILEYLAAGESVENILNAYPILEREDISAALQYASAILDKNISSSPQFVYRKTFANHRIHDSELRTLNSKL